MSGPFRDLVGRYLFWLLRGWIGSPEPLEPKKDGVRYVAWPPRGPFGRKLCRGVVMVGRASTTPGNADRYDHFIPAGLRR